MLDVIFYANPTWQYEAALDALLKFTSAELRVILVLDGGKRSEYRKIEDKLRAAQVERAVLHHAQAKGVDQSVIDALKLVNEDKFVFIDGILLNDWNWLAKLMAPLVTDSTAALSAYFDYAVAPPSRLPFKSGYILPPCRLFAAKKVVVQDPTPCAVQSLRAHFTAAGNSSWLVSNIKTFQ